LQPWSRILRRIDRMASGMKKVGKYKVKWTKPRDRPWRNSWSSFEARMETTKREKKNGRVGRIEGRFIAKEESLPAADPSPSERNCWGRVYSLMAESEKQRSSCKEDKRRYKRGGECRPKERQEETMGRGSNGWRKSSYRSTRDWSHGLWGSMEK
jgi:hypothetical protein